jgi:hypothetical protein
MILKIFFLVFAGIFISACSSSSKSNKLTDLAADVVEELSDQVTSDIPAADNFDTASPDSTEILIPDGSEVSDIAEAGDSDAAEVIKRSIVHNPLFGDTHPQNMLIDPGFSVHWGGLGNWEATSFDVLALGMPSYGSFPMSDSPSGIALNIAYIANGQGLAQNMDLALVAQVAGGPGPWHLKVWISTYDAAESGTLSGVTVGLLTSLNSEAIEVTEDATKTKVIAGRTWHLFDGIITQDLAIGGFVVFEFAASKNTWFIQSPDFYPAATEAPAGASGKFAARSAKSPRPMSFWEKELVRHYIQKPRISVPASHPLINDMPKDLQGFDLSNPLLNPQ